MKSAAPGWPVPPCWVLRAVAVAGSRVGGELVFTASPDDTGTASKLVDKYNESNQGELRVVFREGRRGHGQRFDQLRTEMQAGGENIDVILGDVIWTAQLGPAAGSRTSPTVSPRTRGLTSFPAR